MKLERSCNNENMVFILESINETWSYVHCWTCISEKSSKYKLFHKRKSHNYKMYVPTAYIPGVNSNLLYEGKLHDKKSSKLEIKITSVKFTVYAKKRKGIIWNTELKCG